MCPLPSPIPDSHLIGLSVEATSVQAGSYTDASPGITGTRETAPSRLSLSALRRLLLEENLAGRSRVWGMQLPSG